MTDPTKRSFFPAWRRGALLCALSVVGLMLGASPGYADDDDDGDEIAEFSRELRKEVRLKNIRRHQKAFQRFADGSDGTRVSGSRGYDNSVRYVARKMRRAGYDVEVQEFDFVFWTPLGPSTLEQLLPDPVVYVEDEDYSLMSQTEPGDVTGFVTAVDLELGLGNESTSGCEVADFTGFPDGNIALIQRGACSFQQKAENAAEAGAAGAIIFNQGNTEERRGLIGGTLQAGYSGGIPVFDATYARGEEWAGTPGLRLRMIADVLREPRTTFNVIADSQQGDPNNVVVVGAHLDSVPEGPGVQDNGSGSAAILEIALQLADEFDVNEAYDDDDDDDSPLRNRVRFAWWGAEESGLIGSDYYVFESLTMEELDQIALYLNFDMIGSPNFVRFIYDGDGSAFGLEGPPGSDEIEAVYEEYFEMKGLASEPTEISFRSDYAAFFDSGIPFGGLFTGAEGIKTAEQEEIYGGTEGEQYDPCYHLACDTFENISLRGLNQMSDAAAHSVAVWTASDVSTLGAAPAARAFASRTSATRGQIERRGHDFIR